MHVKYPGIKCLRNVPKIECTQQMGKSQRKIKLKIKDFNHLL